MRGIRSGRDQNRRGRRIIPALAGNICALPRRVSPTRDHPRSRGEYLISWYTYSWHPGSSPLSGGIRSFAPNDSSEGGIIPALAGNTNLPPAPTRTNPDHPRSRGNTHSYGSWEMTARDHPRSRGEYQEEDMPLTDGEGSSPLSRGIRLWSPPHGGAVGIIPALAGNTYSGIAPP